MAYFDSAVVKKTIQINNPTTIYINHLDYLDEQIFGNEALFLKSEITLEFITSIEAEIGRKFDCLGFGPLAQHILKANKLNFKKGANREC